MCSATDCGNRSFQTNTAAGRGARQIPAVSPPLSVGSTEGPQKLLRVHAREETEHMRLRVLVAVGCVTIVAGTVAVIRMDLLAPRRPNIVLI